jgi:ribosomal subunit interface protein
MTDKAILPAKMKVHFTHRHTNGNKGIQAYATESVARFTKHYDGVTDCHIVLDYQSNDKVNNKIAEITASVHDRVFVSKEADETYEKAIDKATEHICKQLQKHKEKVRQL